MYEFDRIETPENVELEQPLTGIGSRFCAGLLDALILVGLGVIVVLLIWIFLATDPLDLTRTLLASQFVIVAIIILVFLVYWGYFVFFEMRTNGQSPGKRRMKIRVVKRGGMPIVFADIVIRNLLRVVDGLFFYAVGGAVMFLTRRTQRLGDLAAGTVVVSEALPDYAATEKRRAVIADSQLSAEGLRNSGLTPEEFRILNNYWKRRYQLTLEARNKLLPRLLAPILERVEQPVRFAGLAQMEDYVQFLLQLAMAPGAAATLDPGPGANTPVSDQDDTRGNI